MTFARRHNVFWAQITDAKRAYLHFFIGLMLFDRCSVPSLPS